MKEMAIIWVIFIIGVNLCVPTIDSKPTTGELKDTVNCHSNDTIDTLKLK